MAAEDSLREKRKFLMRSRILLKTETKARIKQVKIILTKPELLRSEKELEILRNSQEIVIDLEERTRKQVEAKRRVEELVDPPDVLEEKVQQLVNVITEAECVVVYTGAGISTAASIPDYRGPNGVWTMLSRGEKVKSCNICDAEPTLTHMSLCKLYEEGMIQHVVSQNCDGLHIRSGLPKEALSEVHGNMFVEVCTECDPERSYYRLFDVTERTGLRRHSTGRHCYCCGSELRDTIVHFGEKGCITWPLNWEGAIAQAKKADCILCLGSSLKILKRYHALWGMTRIKSRRPKLIIVNLQWTPKDENASLKINAKCDDVMERLMDKLDLEPSEYKRNADPLFKLATPLSSHEYQTYTTKPLSSPHELHGKCPHPVVIETKDNHHDVKSPLECTLAAENNVKILNESELESTDCENGITPGWYGKGYATRKTRGVTKRRKAR